MTAWPLVPLREVLIHRQETPSDGDLMSGRVAIVQKISFNTGTIDLRSGGYTKTGMILVHPGDLLISGINAAKGAIALYDGECKSTIAATIHYGAYQVVRAKADPHFLWWSLRSDIFRQILGRSLPGGIKTELKAKRLLPIRIPLPPLEEQRRIVERINEIWQKIGQLTPLRADAAKETESLNRSSVETVFVELSSRNRMSTVEQVCLSVTDGDHQTPHFSEEGVKFIFVGNVSSGLLHFSNCKYVTPGYFSNLKPQRVPKRGDMLYTAVGATLGVAALVETDEPFCFQRHVAILKPDRGRIDVRFMWHMLRSQTVFRKAWASTTGTAQPTVPLRAIKQLPIPLPPLSVQRTAVQRLDELQDRLDRLAKHQSSTRSEVEALLPSVLSRAFQGEL